MVEVEEDQGRGDDAADSLGFTLTLRRALNAIFSRALERSPMARMPLGALLNCCRSAVSTVGTLVRSFSGTGWTHQHAARAAVTGASRPKLSDCTVGG